MKEPSGLSSPDGVLNNLCSGSNLSGRNLSCCYQTSWSWWRPQIQKKMSDPFFHLIPSNSISSLIMYWSVIGAGGLNLRLSLMTLFRYLKLLFISSFVGFNCEPFSRFFTFMWAATSSRTLSLDSLVLIRWLIAITIEFLLVSYAAKINRRRSFAIF